MRCKFQSKGVDFHQVPGLSGWTGIGVSSIKQTFHVETLSQTLKAIVFMLVLCGQLSPVFSYGVSDQGKDSLTESFGNVQG